MNGKKFTWLLIAIVVAVSAIVIGVVLSNPKIKGRIGYHG